MLKTSLTPSSRYAKIFNSQYSKNLNNPHIFCIKTYGSPYLLYLTKVNNVNYSLLIDDINNDGFQDLITGGNFSGVPPDLGRYDASFGEIFLGDGQGSFTSLNFHTSGFVVNGEIRQMKKIKNPNKYDRRPNKFQTI